MDSEKQMDNLTRMKIYGLEKQTIKKYSFDQLSIGDFFYFNDHLYMKNTNRTAWDFNEKIEECNMDVEDVTPLFDVKIIIPHKGW